jgi:phospholipid transport system substrate-binding protein
MTPSRRRALLAVALAVPAAIAFGGSAARAVDPPAAAGTAARAIVDGFNAALLDAMKNAKTLGIKGRYDRLAPQVKRLFDLRVMIAIASGTAWGKATPAEQDRLTDAFGRFSIATYAHQFDSFSGQSFETTSVAAGPRGTMIVNTRLLEPNESPVKLAYVTRKNDVGWQIVDVLVDDGISQLAVRRSEYSAILAQKGIPGLMAELDSKTEKLLASK